MMMVFSVSTDHTNKDVTDGMCVCNVAGELALLSTILGGSISNLNGQAMSCLRSLQMLPSFQCIQGFDPQNTQQNEVWKGCWPIWHHSWDAENCCLGRSWTDETTDRGCFSYAVTPSDWEGSFMLNLYMDKGGALDCGTYYGLKLTDQVMKLSLVVLVPNGMYSNARSCMRVIGQYIILVLEALSREFTDVTWDHLYADDLVLIVDTQEKCISKLRPIRLAWRVKHSVSTRRKLSSLSVVLAMISSRYLGNTPVLSAAVVWATTQSSAGGEQWECHCCQMLCGLE